MFQVALAILISLASALFAAYFTVGILFALVSGLADSLDVPRPHVRWVEFIWDALTWPKTLVE